MPVEETCRAVEIVETGRRPVDRVHTRSPPPEQAEDAARRWPGRSAA